MMFAETDINPNVIIVFVAVIIAGIKALIEKRNQENQPPAEEGQSEYDDLYEAYEAELEAQRQQQIPAEVTPPPLPTPAPAIEVPKVEHPSIKTATLSAAEEEALERFNSRQHSPSENKNQFSTRARVKAHLSSPTAAREALLLAEILGPPKAFK